ncbi:MFS transporter [Rhodopila sp.]|uniref:MFS transporter n=1 Tax=Rhodopila sp. TaxID=2480087 RepID=UPI003D11AFAD
MAGRFGAASGTASSGASPPDVSLLGMPRWMLCYVLLGLVQSGMVPVILPLAAAPGPAAGLTYAAFAAAGIAAPFIGAWSDRHRRHRRTLAAGLGLAGLGLIAHSLPGGLVQHMASAALIGFGASSASTVATMFIVEVVPEAAWDGQISALQACTGGGQLGGLLIAGALGLHHVEAAFLLGAAVLLAAVPLALAFAPDPLVKVSRADLAPRPARGGDAIAIGPQRSLHRVSWRAIAGLGHSGLAWFLAAWLVSYTATNGLSVMFAVAMVRDYHAPATWPTTAYAIGVGCSLLVYRLVGRWDSRFGPWRVLGAGLASRALLVGGLVVLTASHAQTAMAPILLCFAATQVAWPLLSVASTRLSVTLSPAHRAESAGLLNAATSVGATIGGVVGGVLLHAGFVWLCAAVLAALVLSLLLAWHPRVRLGPA